ncbi:hypothetical protein GALL_405420 [mine drainage metagenome]|uniref:Uncharacterized protein n=1 Tax=mine drainage metagenome TaxID=410659 RepID=A0A1J5Q242_9ZZZZ
MPVCGSTPRATVPVDARQVSTSTPPISRAPARSGCRSVAHSSFTGPTIGETTPGTPSRCASRSRSRTTWSTDDAVAASATTTTATQTRRRRQSPPGARRSPPPTDPPTGPVGVRVCGSPEMGHVLPGRWESGRPASPATRDGGPPTSERATRRRTGQDARPARYLTRRARFLPAGCGADLTRAP